jgi:hypothetical protein
LFESKSNNVSADHYFFFGISNISNAQLTGLLVDSSLQIQSETTSAWDRDAVPLLVLLVHRPSNTTFMVIVTWFFRALGNALESSLSHCSPTHSSSLAHDNNANGSDTKSRRVVRDCHGLVGVSLALWAAGQAAFFATGNSHTVSTIDISGAYTGLLEYNQWIVGGLTGVITFSGPLLAADQIARLLCFVGESSAVTKLRSDNSRERSLAGQGARAEASQAVASGLFLYQSLRLLVTSIVLVLMRAHLFVWSVFAPKWAYEVLQHLTAVLCCVALVAVTSFCKR